jgi:hypothetical protein
VRAAAAVASSAGAGKGSGLGLLMSAVAGHSRGEIVGSMFAAHLLQGGQAYYASHVFVSIMVSDFVEYVEGKVQWSEIRPAANTVIASPVQDYVARPGPLGSLCAWEYMAWYRVVDKRRLPKGQGMPYLLACLVCSVLIPSLRSGSFLGLA